MLQDLHVTEVTPVLDSEFQEPKDANTINIKFRGRCTPWR